MLEEFITDFHTLACGRLPKVVSGLVLAAILLLSSIDDVSSWPFWSSGEVGFHPPVVMCSVHARRHAKFVLQTPAPSQGAPIQLVSSAVTDVVACLSLLPVIEDIVGHPSPPAVLGVLEDATLATPTPTLAPRERTPPLAWPDAWAPFIALSVLRVEVIAASLVLSVLRLTEWPVCSTAECPPLLKVQWEWSFPVSSIIPADLGMVSH
ncbi:hypothetical protein AcV7_004919 [Taiwanofungus camphoratus]|nr:hypothetical protein AcV7_004919 [Antrodia cinnamomea]